MDTALAVPSPSTSAEVAARRAQRTQRMVTATGFLAIAGQRLGVSFGGAVLSLAAVSIVVMYVRLLLSGARISSIGLTLWCALVAIGGLGFLSHPDAHAGSLLIMLAIYLSLLLLPAGPDHATGHGRAFLLGAVTAIKIGAVLALVQAALQWAGSTTLWDPISSFVPTGLQVAGYNTHYSLQYVETRLGMSFKPNGVIFLEPSRLSFYSAIALAWLGQRRLVERDQSPNQRPLLWAVVLLAALAVSISTSGLPILAFAAAPLFPRLARNRRALLGVVVLVATGWYVGLFDAIFGKATEGFNASTSTGIRLTVPYQLMFPHIGSAFGSGAGTASDLADTFGIRGLQVPTVMKAALEYGLLGALTLAVATIVVVIGSKPPAVLLLAALAAWLIPAEALLNPAVAAIMFFAVPHWGGAPTHQDRPRAPTSSS